MPEPGTAPSLPGTETGRPQAIHRLRDGEAAVLRQGGHEEGPVDGGGGPEARRLPPHPRPLLLARRPQARRAAEVREELQAAVDQLPEARPQAGPPLRRRGAARHRPARAAREQVVQDRGAATGEDGQRDQEPLEHTHPQEAAPDGDRPRHPPPIAGAARSSSSSSSSGAGAGAGRPGRRTAAARAAGREAHAGGRRGGRGRRADGPAARDHHGAATTADDGGKQLRLCCCFLCLRRVRVRGLAVLLLLLGLSPRGDRRGGDGVAGARVPVRHGWHHGRRLGRPLPQHWRWRWRLLRLGRRRSVRPVPRRRRRRRLRSR